ITPRAALAGSSQSRRFSRGRPRFQLLRPAGPVLLALGGLPLSPPSGPPSRFAPRQTPGQKRSSGGLAQTKAKAPLAASVLVEEGSRATNATGASLQTVPPRLSARIGYAGDHAPGCHGVSRSGPGRTLCAAMA